ncbi:MAG: SCO family protein [Burkholderiaceae bacterium]
MTKPLPDCSTRRMLLAGTVALFGLCTLRHARSAPDEHATHRAEVAEAAQGQVRRSLESYRVPRVEMRDQHGNRVRFDRELDDGRGVILNFIFTSCAAICPVMTQIFSQVQSKLISQGDKVHMVSVSIDPEYDTPQRLLAYAKEYHAAAQWDFYTGTNDASVAVRKAFDAYRGDKMNHAALTLMRAPGSQQWVRLDGFASPEQIVREYRAIAR